MNEFQRLFVQALFDPDAGGPLAGQPGLRVYRNTVMAGCVDALEANFPTVCQFVGSEWFRAAARIHVDQHPPLEPALMRYGRDFPAFIDGFAPAAEMPCLADLARADWMHLESLFASDDEPLPPSRVAGLDPPRLGALRLRPRASARWGWFGAAPIATLWQRHRAARQAGAETHLADVVWRAEGLLLVCDGEAVHDWLLERPAIAFLDACAAGGTLLDSTAAALAVDADCDLASLMRLLIHCGAFAAGDDGHSTSTGALAPESTQEKTA